MTGGFYISVVLEKLRGCSPVNEAALQNRNVYLEWISKVATKECHYILPAQTPVTQAALNSFTRTKSKSRSITPGCNTEFQLVLLTSAR